MSQVHRPHVPRSSVFFTAALAQPGSDLLIHAVQHLRDAVRQTRVERPFHINAWVVLPDHMHCVWTLPEGDTDFSIRWTMIKTRFAGLVRRDGPRPAMDRGGDFALWPLRQHSLRNAVAVSAAVQRCWGDPVRHGLVQDPTDWVLSSIHRDHRPGPTADDEALRGGVPRPRSRTPINPVVQARLLDGLDDTAGRRPVSAQALPGGLWVGELPGP
ncbi:MAG: transposase [Gemmobacter sp.]|nr:transposase [Gemmobacter sp.]